MGTTKKYWKSFAQLNNDPEFQKKAQEEFPSEIPMDAFLGDDKLSETKGNRIQDS
jgi:MoCo/4Fe-4S cofactor protein with predicted Tat translocation signal